MIDFFNEKGILILNKNRTINLIERYSFYNIINTYKGPFKNKEGLYRKGVSFEDIFNFYCFDKNLRIIFIKY